MKKITTLSSLCGLFVFAHTVCAECTLNGEVVPCEDLSPWLFAMPFLVSGAMFIIMMPALIFWIWMIIDAAKNEKNNDAIIWILILVFLHILGAVIYYFVRKRPRKSEVPAPPMPQVESKGDVVQQ